LTLLRAALPSKTRAGADLAADKLVVEGEETQLQQVVVYLCLNARDAMHNGGCVHVRTRPEIDSGGRLWARLAVEDGGEGMSEHTRAHLFEPFYSTKERGTGLGLAVVLQIVESFGGRVEVASEPGQGTRFDVWWPAAAPEPCESCGAGSAGL
jgi:signal transduction histidine kinase